ncbi:MAG: hypothetical protein K5739_12745 [Lachnospiraceae bacterium]|nr:hypothetical protein [Lachnospiraceae bacterium]
MPFQIVRLRLMKNHFPYHRNCMGTSMTFGAASVFLKADKAATRKKKGASKKTEA